MLSAPILMKSLGAFFQLDDPDRGLSTGATGRTEVWKIAWNLFLQNPILGVGFRAHEKYPGLSASSHNGYLALLVETECWALSPPCLQRLLAFLA